MYARAVLDWRAQLNCSFRRTVVVGDRRQASICPSLSRTRHVRPCGTPILGGIRYDDTGVVFARFPATATAPIDQYCLSRSTRFAGDRSITGEGESTAVTVRDRESGLCFFFLHQVLEQIFAVDGWDTIRYHVASSSVCPSFQLLGSCYFQHVSGIVDLTRFVVHYLFISPSADSPQALNRFR